MLNIGSILHVEYGCSRKRCEEVDAARRRSSATHLLVDPLLIAFQSVTRIDDNLVILARIVDTTGKIQAAIVTTNLAQFAQHEELENTPRARHVNRTLCSYLVTTLRMTWIADDGFMIVLMVRTSIHAEARCNIAYLKWART